mmetsp:Transcript_11945/g.37367  ORF Transcript_11945/g.37367 Transcript_11945/m.37367 type:complete len:287 (-) Transcript_11945:163-1023(-)
MHTSSSRHCHSSCRGQRCHPSQAGCPRGPLCVHPMEHWGLCSPRHHPNCLHCTGHCVWQPMLLMLARWHHDIDKHRNARCNDDKGDECRLYDKQPGKEEHVNAGSCCSRLPGQKAKQHREAILLVLNLARARGELAMSASTACGTALSAHSSSTAARNSSNAPVDRTALRPNPASATAPCSGVNGAVGANTDCRGPRWPELRAEPALDAMDGERGPSWDRPDLKATTPGSTRGPQLATGGGAMPPNNFAGTGGVSGACSGAVAAGLMAGPRTRGAGRTRGCDHTAG